MEGGLQKPTRFDIDWKNADYLNEDLFEKELRRVADACHGCRRCVSLCNSFPTLFDLIDESKTFEVDGVSYNQFSDVIDHCYLCDLCFLTKCPYVPPHEWEIDFPHLMLRYRFAERAKIMDLVSDDRWNFSRPLDRVLPLNSGFQRCNRVAFVFELSLVYDFSGTDVLSGTPQKKKHLCSDCSDGRPGVDRDIGFVRSGYIDSGTGPPWTQLGNFRKFQFYCLDPAQPQACPAASSADRSLLAEWFCCFGSDSISTEAPMAVQS